MTVAEMVIHLNDHGFKTYGRTSKTISDALRWEIARGRITRLRRGVYKYRQAPKTTARRIRLFAKRCTTWITAMHQNQTPPPTPATPPHRQGKPIYSKHDPTRAPWDYLGWLWTT